MAEGSYLYPMPGEAVFTDFSLFQGDEELKGEMMNAQDARAIYEEIVRRKRDPALLTLAGHGLVRAQVFPIQPGETRKIILRYTQLLTRDGNAWRLSYPLGARGDGPIAVTATANGAGRLGVPYSPTHDIDWHTNNDRVVVRVEADPAGTLELLFPQRTGLVGTSLITHAPGGDDRFFMLVVSPPAVETEESMPRDLTLVADISGSMAGNKLAQAQAALLQALSSLRPDDRFRVIAFSTGVTEFADGFSPATPNRIRQARRFVEDLRARGGTNIDGALEAALASTARSERMSIVLFLTDGLPSVGEQSPERLATTAASRRGSTRIFPVGIGHDVNTYLLDRLAVEGRGRVEYVAPEADVETAVGATLARIDAPVLTDLRVVRSPVRLVETAPSDLPDLFAGEELVLMGRYAGSASGGIIIEGRRNGRTQRFTAQVSFPRHERKNDFIPSLWAGRRIGELTRQVRLEGPNKTLIARIKELGLRYGILTEYTAYLVQEPSAIVAGDLRRDMAPSTPAPEAQSGEVAFLRAERSAQLSMAKNLAAADEVARDNDRFQPGRTLERRRAGGRLFINRDNVWTDAAHSDTVEIVEITAFSTAYFELTRELPEIRALLTAGDEVIIAGKGVSLRIGARGVERWTPGALSGVIRKFRGA
jgi:Ca-activated chloride channel family protein